MGQTAFHGNVGKVRGLKFSDDGKPRFSFSVGESHSRFNKQSNQFQDTGTTWRNVTVFGKRAETLADVIQEGAKQQVVVFGREETRAYDNNGTPGSSIDCIAEVVGIIPKSAPNGPPQQARSQQAQPPASDPWGAPASSDPAF